MSLQALDPTDFELRLATTRNAVPKCPFCGTGALLHSSVNDDAFGGKTVYQSRVSCLNHHCNANVICNMRELEAAQQGALQKWSSRECAPGSSAALQKAVLRTASFYDAVERTEGKFVAAELRGIVSDVAAQAKREEAKVQVQGSAETAGTGPEQLSVSCADLRRLIERYGTTQMQDLPLGDAIRALIEAPDARSCVE